MAKEIKMQVTFLGDKNICLKRSNKSLGERIVNCNELLEMFAKNDRNFFSNTKTGYIAKFALENDKIIYYDAYQGDIVKNTHLTDKKKWRGRFNDGGTNQDIVMCLTNYIKTAIPFFYWYLRMENSGYKEETINKIKEFGLSKNIFTVEKRIRFWVHNEKNLKTMHQYIEKNNIDINKCIVVLANTGDINPTWTEEFNFIHTGFTQSISQNN